MKQIVSIILIALTSLSCGEKQASSIGLEAFANKDLRKGGNHTSRQLRQRLATLTGDKVEVKSEVPYEMWWMRPFRSGDSAWLLLEAYPGYDVPDVSCIQVHVFDKSWKRLIKQSIPTGYRFYLQDVGIVNDRPLKRDVLVAKVTSTGPFILDGSGKRSAFEQGDFQRQYFSIRGEEFVLVRLDDDNDKLVQNHYSWRAPLKGPSVPKRTKQEWIDSLSSADPVDPLATMVWLSGVHLRSTEPRMPDHNQESVEDSTLLESVRDSAKTRKILRQLTESRNPWVNEYAKFTLRVISE